MLIGKFIDGAFKKQYLGWTWKELQEAAVVRRAWHELVEGICSNESNGEGGSRSSSSMTLNHIK